MLQSLEIKDFALIEKLRVDWTAGLNILTGETGAGKSILMDALNTVLGGKAGAGFIRSGAEKACIEAEFAMQPAIASWLREQELLDETEADTFIISREITKSGTRIRFNGTLVNASLVQELAQALITVHAQHESRTLMSPQTQLEMLDSLGDPAHKKLLESYRTAYGKRRELLSRLKEMQMSEDERLRKLEFSRFQLHELEQANLLSANEDEELAAQQLVLANAAQIEQWVHNGFNHLSGSEHEESASCAVDQLQSALVEVERAARLDRSLDDLCDLIRSATAGAEEAARGLRRYSSQLETKPEALAAVETRIATLASIKRKYGPTLDNAITLTGELRDVVDTLENAQNKIEELSNQLDALNAEAQELAARLSKNRKKIAEKLSASVESELKDLGMERCQFKVAFEALTEPGASGLDRLEFVIAPNPGQPAMPLGKIASGGELSRIMLAIKSIFALADNVPTVIFDEIDTGLSGKTLQSMRDKLARLANSHQILCITHQPIIASVADNHIEVRKEHGKDQTRVFARQLDETERLRSLASMASGEADQTVALTFAQSLIEQANQVKGIR